MRQRRFERWFLGLAQIGGMECSIESTGYVMSVRAAEVYVKSCAEVAVGLMFFQYGHDFCWHARPSVGVLHPEVCVASRARYSHVYSFRSSSCTR